MTDLRLPFWVVTDRTVAGREPCDNPKSIHAFPSTENLTDFLDGRVAENWRVSLVAHREGFIVAIADAHRNGSSVICFGPARDEAGGETLNLVDLLAVVESLAYRAA